MFLHLSVVSGEKRSKTVLIKAREDDDVAVIKMRPDEGIDKVISLCGCVERLALTDVMQAEAARFRHGLDVAI